MLSKKEAIFFTLLTQHPHRCVPVAQIRRVWETSPNHNSTPYCWLTESSWSIKNTSFCSSRSNKYHLMVLLIGLRHVLWSQARSPSRTFQEWVWTFLQCYNSSPDDVLQTTLSLHSPISLWAVRNFAASHNESFLVILYPLGRLDSAFFSPTLSSSIWVRTYVSQVKSEIYI